MKIYKVVVPTILLWPHDRTTLKVTMTREEAQKFIDEHPNPYLQWIMFIEEEDHEFPETD